MKDKKKPDKHPRFKKAKVTSKLNLMHDRGLDSGPDRRNVMKTISGAGGEIEIIVHRLGKIMSQCDISCF